MKTLLFLLASFIALTSVISGLLMISNPEGGILNIPSELLANTPFHNFLIPGILLTCLVGGTNLLAVYNNLRRHPNRYNWAIAGGMMISGWIIVQMILIGTIHFLHLVYLGIGLLMILIAYQLKGKWAV